MELFRLLGTIAINSDGAKKSIDDVTDSGEKAHSKLSGAFSKIGSAAMVAGKVVAAGVGACATAITAIGKAAVDNYADYEQLVGGVETLFGTQGMTMSEYACSVGKSVLEINKEYNRLNAAQDLVMRNASNAYKTAGLSANEYMETVTSFSASLIQSLEGDTLKAAEKANQAIVDMSDNANKMGTSMEMIQNAYNGFAKQNYTMLDNLKLGYGGTKEEMQRLLEDATALSGIEYDISSYADVVDAIHVIQTEMGITGTTAKEASETIAGSFTAMKASWQNLLTGMADEDADVDQLLNELFSSAGNFGKNIIPRIEATMKGIGSAIEKALPKVLESVSSLIYKFAPKLVSTALEMLGMIGTAILEKLPQMVSDILWTVASLFDGNSFLGSFLDTIASLWDAFTGLGSAMSENGDIQNAFSAIGTAFNTVWQSFIKPVYDGITSGINWLAENWAVVSANISATFEGLWAVCQSVWTSIGQPIWGMIQSAILIVYDAFADIMPKVMRFFEVAVAGIKDSWNNHLKPALDAIGKFLNDVLKPVFEEVFEVIIQPLVENTFNFIKDLWGGTLKPVFDGICDFLLGVFTLDFETALNGLNDIAEGCFNAIQTTVETVFGTIEDIIGGAIDKIKEFFGFAEDANEVDLPSGEPTHGGGGGARSANTAPVYSSASAANTVFSHSAASFMAESGQVATQTVSGADIASVVKDALRDLKVVVHADIVPDKQGIFKIVQSEAEIWKESTGKEAFA